jgi:hypothetical protein
MYDEILMQETRERLQEQDLDPESIEENLRDMAEAGSFDIPEED